MIYTTCKAACPRLIADMRAIQTKVPKKHREEVQFVLISIDPETDTPKRLNEFAIKNEMFDPPWLFLRGSEADTREFAAVLAISYKKISPMDFSHSNIISVFNKEGVLIHQREGFDNEYTTTLEAITKALN